MILSFSERPMLPYIRAGIRQARGEDVGAERVKRCTIRRIGKRAEQLLAYDRSGRSIPYDLHLWWKSRTKERELLGVLPNARVHKITILHSEVIPPDAPRYQCIRIDGRHGWRNGSSMLFWSPGSTPGEFDQVARQDGFDSVEAFRDYFVPNPGDVFDGILYRW